MNFLSAHRSSNPITPATQSVCRCAERAGGTIRTSARRARSSFDLDRRPKPKGGGGASIQLPLSGAMLRCLWRVRVAGRMLYPMQVQGWIFPATSMSGHVEEIKSRKISIHGHALRRSYSNGPGRCGVWAFAPWPVAQPAPRGAHAASKGGRLKLTVVRRIGAGHWTAPTQLVECLSPLLSRHAAARCPRHRTRDAVHSPRRLPIATQASSFRFP